jgi:hypothetical protein
MCRWGVIVCSQLGSNTFYDSCLDAYGTKEELTHPVLGYHLVSLVPLLELV